MQAVRVAGCIGGMESSPLAAAIVAIPGTGIACGEERTGREAVGRLCPPGLEKFDPLTPFDDGLPEADGPETGRTVPAHIHPSHSPSACPDSGT